MQKTSTTPAPKQSSRRASINAGLTKNILVDNQTEEATNEVQPPHKGTMTLNYIAEAESTTTLKSEKVLFVGTDEEQTKEKRTTLEMPAILHEKLKIMAHWELADLKEIITSSLEKTVSEYEKEHGELKRVPKSQRKK